MWLALTYLTPDDTGSEVPGELVMIALWPPGDRPLKVAAPPAAVPQLVRLLREAAEGEAGAPRCDACLTPVALPDLDAPSGGDALCA